MDNRKKRRAGEWSYIAGEKGANRVRAYDRGAKGIYLEWWDRDAVTGSRKRERKALPNATREAAKGLAEEVAARLRRGAEVKPKPVAIGTLFDIYERERTPHKGNTAQAHDRRCLAMMRRAFGESRDPLTLSVADWDWFIAERRAGRIRPAGVTAGRAVRNRVIEQDLNLLRAVLRWGTLRRDRQTGTPLLAFHPLRGLPVPREQSPRRPMLALEYYESMRRRAERLGSWVACFLVLAYETGHRGASIRQLRWSDIDLTERTVRWRPELDKIKLEHTTPLTDEAIHALRQWRAKQQGIGDAWIFPSARDASKPKSRNTISNAFTRYARAVGVPPEQLAGCGWHSFRRRLATDGKGQSQKDVMALGGWKTQSTLLMYQQADETTQRAILESRPRGTIAAH